VCRTKGGAGKTANGSSWFDTCAGRMIANIPRYVTLQRFARACGVSRTAVLRAATHQKISPAAIIETNTGAEQLLFSISQTDEFIRHAQPAKRAFRA